MDDSQQIETTCVAVSCGMLPRQELGHRHLNPLFIFGATAFVTTAIAGFARESN